MTHYELFIKLCTDYGKAVARGDLTLLEAIEAIERQMEMT